MKQLTFHKNLLTSSLLNEAIEQQMQILYGNDNEKARLAFILLTNKQKKEEFEIINQCINAVKRHSTYGNYRLALSFLAILQNKVTNFKRII
jgi:hypothetical protein